MSEAAAVTSSGTYERLLGELREMEILGSIGGVLSWDQETMMPPGGAGLRAQQLALMSELVHRRFTDPAIEEMLAACESDTELRENPDAAANLREIRRSLDRAVRLPTSLVKELSETTSRSIQVWKEARERSDFALFAPSLEKVFDLSRAKADCLGGGDSATRYEALMDEYEPDMRVAELEEIFSGLRQQLVPLIAAIAASDRQPDTRLHQLRIPIPEQVAFNAFVATRIGFDLERGRLDVSTHPFCQGVGPGDTRLTTRYREDAFPDALSSTLHESGHGLYEQGLPKEERMGQPLADSASLGIHESQSRLWENMIGRSREFWRWALPEARRHFSVPLPDLDVEEVYGAMNVVRPSLIRVDSDEATYNLHIMLRFDLERAMLAGELPVRDLPGTWNERIQADLGLEVPDDRRGCLQDIHWSMGGIGYFPTYTLGNLYAAQFWAAAQRDLPALQEEIARGEFGSLLGWLRSGIHSEGRRYSAGELCERVTGAALRPDPFTSYLTEKLTPLYGL